MIHKDRPIACAFVIQCVTCVVGAAEQAVAVGSDYFRPLDKYHPWWPSVGVQGGHSGTVTDMGTLDVNVDAGTMVFAGANAGDGAGTMVYTGAPDTGTMVTGTMIETSGTMVQSGKTILRLINVCLLNPISWGCCFHRM